MERLGWYLLVITGIVLCIGIAFFAGVYSAQAEEPAAVTQGTVERRIHLTVDTRWDTDKRRKFECREVK